MGHLGLKDEAVSELLGIARFNFHDGKVEEFKRLSAQCMEIVRTKDRGTLQYDIYFSVDESEDMMTAISATGSVYGEILGKPSLELRANMESGPVRLFTPFASL